MCDAFVPGIELPLVYFSFVLSFLLCSLQLVLDLDETLVHSSFKPVAGADFIMDIMVDGTFYKVRTTSATDVTLYFT